MDNKRRKNNENDVLFTNMWLLRNNFIFGNESIIRKRFSNDLRVFVHNFISTPTSPAVKKMTGLDWIPSYFSNVKRKYKGMQLEHINEVKVLAWLSGQVDVIENPSINSHITIIEGGELGINENQDNNLLVYPNPGKKFHIKINNFNEKMTLYVTDIT